MNRRYASAAAAVLLLFVSATPVARADELNARVTGFFDNGSNYVITSVGKYDAEFLDHFSAGAKITVDAISSATPNSRDYNETVNGLDSASLNERRDRLGGFVGGYSADDGKGFGSGTVDFTKGRRIELAGHAGFEFDDSKLTAGYIYSTESYYLSHTIYGTFEQALALRNTVLTATYYHNFDTVDVRDDKVAKEWDYPKPKGVDGFNLGLTQVLSRKTIAQFVTTAILNAGALVDPERDVFFDLGGNTWGIKPERLPSRRNRYAASARVIHQFWRNSAVEGGYRYYFDDWGIDSHTASLRLSQYVTRWLPVTLTGRYYTQSESDYTRFATDGTEEYYTASPNLQGFDSVLAGIKLSLVADHNLIRKARFWFDAGTNYYRQSARDGVANGYQAAMVFGSLNFEW